LSTWSEKAHDQPKFVFGHNQLGTKAEFGTCPLVLQWEFDDNQETHPEKEGYTLFDCCTSSKMWSCIHPNEGLYV
jgi:hypothetical protein